MGLFSKTKTRVEEIKEKETINKIVKFSYLQSLAISAGSSIEEFTETEGSTSEINNSTLEKNRAQDLGDKLNDIGDGNVLTEILTSTLGAIGSLISGLFGKKVTKDVNLEVQDSGWSFIKSWNEPQFDVIRYAIGIRELSVSQFNYKPVSEFITTPWGSPKDIEKISLIVDHIIPAKFPPGNYIEYYIKPNIDDASWIRINPVDLPTVYDSNNKIVPRIITFNTEQPVNSSLETAYLSTGAPVKSVRLKVVLKRPVKLINSTDDPSAYTPILRSYRLLLTPRGGL